MDVMETFHAQEEKDYQKRVREARVQQSRGSKQATGAAAASSSSSSSSGAAGQGAGLSLPQIDSGMVQRGVWYSDDIETMTKAGTFCGALHYRLVRILQVLIAKMLAFLDRNHGLQLFTRHGPHCYALAQFVVDESACRLQDDMLRGLALGTKDSSLEEVLNDARSDKAPFYSHFPFSYAV